MIQLFEIILMMSKRKKKEVEISKYYKTLNFLASSDTNYNILNC